VQKEQLSINFESTKGRIY